MKFVLNAFPYIAAVDYSKPLEQLIAAAGFRHSSPKVASDRFAASTKGQQSLEIRMVTLADGQECTTREILEWMQSQSIRPVTIQELLTLLAANPELRLPRNPYALGSIWHDENGAAHVVGCRVRRDRILRFIRMEWEPWWTASAAAFASVPL